MNETVAQFEIHHTAYLGQDGTLLRPLPPTVSVETIRTLYRQMTRTRVFDAKAVALQRTGRLGTYASSLGQEAVAVGTASAMQPEDVLLPSFREHGAQLARGVAPVELLLFWGGDERGSDFAGPREDFPVCITVGGHAPHATGAALAFKLRAEPRVAVCVFGDGATSKGDVYEAMNLAGVWQAPVVFIVSNNQWAISVPRAEQTASQTLAQKAVAAGFEGEQVDGNDVVAVADVIGKAVTRARRGGGPRLIECLTYRLADHTTADDATRYRDDAEVSKWWQKDPLARVRTYLGATENWQREDEEQLLRECNAEIDAAADEYMGIPAQDPQSAFDHVYAALPADLVEQRDFLRQRGR